MGFEFTTDLLQLRPSYQLCHTALIDLFTLQGELQKMTVLWCINEAQLFSRTNCETHSIDAVLCCIKYGIESNSFPYGHNAFKKVLKKKYWQN